MRANLVVPSLVVSSLAGLAIALAATGASAQTVISRSISAQPVETTVTQTPGGTIVTRRPVERQVVQPITVPPATVLPVPMVVESDTIDAITTREVVRRAEATRAAPARAMTTRQVSARQDLRTTRTPRQTVHKTARATPRLALNPRERHIVYRTIVEREVVPRQQVIVAPSVVPAPTYLQPQIALPARPPIVAADEVEIVQPGAITVGSVLPANVPLYAIPQNVALSVPATQPYSYAYLGGRAFLVDPANGTVVADVTE